MNGLNAIATPPPPPFFLPFARQMAVMTRFNHRSIRALRSRRCLGQKPPQTARLCPPARPLDSRSQSCGWIRPSVQHVHSFTDQSAINRSESLVKPLSALDERNFIDDPTSSLPTLYTEWPKNLYEFESKRSHKRNFENCWNDMDHCTEEPAKSNFLNYSISVIWYFQAF